MVEVEKFFSMMYSLTMLSYTHEVEGKIILYVIRLEVWLVRIFHWKQHIGKMGGAEVEFKDE